MTNDTGVDSIQCFFSKKFKTPSALEIHKWIFEEIKLEKKDVKNIRFDYDRNALYLKLASDTLGEKLARENNGILKFRHVDGNVSDVVVMLVGYGIRKIKVCDLPFEIPDEEIAKSLTVYGSVMTVTRDKWPKTFIFHVENGVRTVKMNLWKHVPSFKFICGFRAFISYAGQPETCSVCNGVGHFRKECPRKRPPCDVTCDDILNATLATSLPQSPASRIKAAELSQAEGMEQRRTGAPADASRKGVNVTTLQPTAVPAVTIGGRRRRQAIRKRAE